MVSLLNRLSRAFKHFVVRASGRFDRSYYLENNPDVAAAGCDPVEHFCTWGWKELRNPSAVFDSRYYANRYISYDRPVNPLIHWALFGAWRRRSTNYPEAIEFLKRVDPIRGDYGLIFVVHDCSRTGAPVFLLRLLKEMINNGAIDASKTAIIVLGNGPLLSEFCALCDTLLLWLVPKADRKSRIAEFMGQNSAQVLYINSIASAGIISYLDHYNERLICHIHEMNDSAVKFKSECELLKEHCRDFIAVSKGSVDVVKDVINLPNARIDLILPGVPIRPLQKEMTLSNQPIRILGCGTTSFRKGTDLFCDIADRLSELGVAFEMRWAGAQGDVEMASRISNSGMEKQLSWFGEQETMTQLFEWADILLLPSREDPFPLVALEAGERGVPTICFDERAGGIYQVMEQGCGIVVPYLDVAEMTMAVIHVAKNPEHLLTLSKAAREVISKDFDLEKISRKIASIIFANI